MPFFPLFSFTFDLMYMYFSTRKMEYTGLLVGGMVELGSGGVGCGAKSLAEELSGYSTPCGYNRETTRQQAEARSPGEKVKPGEGPKTPWQ